jgi:quercetin dioxygenase-like cupin family protein
LKKQKHRSASQKLQEQVRTAILTDHDCQDTEQTQLERLKRFILFHEERHPSEEPSSRIRRKMMKIAKIDRLKAGEDPTHDPYIDRSHYFDGEVIVQSLVGAEDSSEVELLAVFFSAGARTRPHIHEKDQMLHFIEGQGIVATETEKRAVSQGEVVTIPAGTWHWHGAARDSATCHISIRQPGLTNWEVEAKNWASGYQT